MKLVAALLALTAAPVAAQLTSFLAAPEPLWSAPISPQGEGNECAYSPTAMLVCTSADGFVNAIDPQPATPASFLPLWNFLPDVVGTQMTSSSGVSFSASTEFGSFVVYGTTDATAAGNVCRIHALGMADGKLLWSSPSLVGACSGTPVIGLEGDYVYVTHNEDMSGTFSVLDAGDGTVFYEESDITQPLSPPAIFHNPIRGSYTGGEGNRNDMVVWCNKPFPGEEGVLSGSTSYAFQLPVGFTGSMDGVAVVTLLEDTDFQADAPALLTNFGTSLFWPVSRNAIVAWPSTTFDKSPGGNKVSFSPRGTPASRPIIAEMAVSRGLGASILFSGSAANHFGAIDVVEVEGFEKIQEKWTIDTTSPVYARAQVAPDDSHVYAIEENGTVRMIDVATGAIVWTLAVQGKVLGSGFAQTFDGDQIFFADTAGFVHAWKVGEAEPVAPTTPAPVAPTTPAPVLVTIPTAAPVVALPPIVSPPLGGNITAAPVTSPPVEGNVTAAPVAPGTAAPVVPVTTVVDVIVAKQPPLSTLISLVEATNATAFLTDPELGSTVFAPYDEAFAADFTEDYLTTYVTDLMQPEWMHHARCYVGNHVGSGLISTTDMWTDGQEVMSPNEESLTLGTTPVASVNGIPVADADNTATNGVVQYLATGTILSECVSVNILQAGQTDPQFSTLVALVTKTGIATALATQRPLTLFAPSNAAFDALDPEVLAYLTNDTNTEELRDVLFYHLVRANLVLEDESDTGVFTTTNSETVNITMVGVDWFVNDVKIQSGGLFQNGVVQVIDEVLVPPSFALPTMAPITSSPVTVAPATSAPNVTVAPATMPPIIPTMPTLPTTVSPVTVAPVTVAPVTVFPSSTPSDSPSSDAVTAPVSPAPTPPPFTPPTPVPPPTSSAATVSMLGLVVAAVVGFCL